MINEKEFLQCQENLQYYKSKCASLEEGLFDVRRDYEKLRKELIEFFNRIDLDESNLNLDDLTQLAKIMKITYEGEDEYNKGDLNGFK